MTTQKIKISDFNFCPAGYGHYKVTYQSPVTLKTFTVTTSNMPLIDVTKNSDNPKVSDLNTLKSICKS